MSLAAQIALLLAPGAVILIGWLIRMTVWDRINQLEKAISDLAEKQNSRVDLLSEKQGKRIGDLESWQYAVERETKAVRRVRREIMSEEQSRGIPAPVGDEDSEP